MGRIEILDLESQEQRTKIDILQTAKAKSDREGGPFVQKQKKN